MRSFLLLSLFAVLRENTQPNANENTLRFETGQPTGRQWDATQKPNLKQSCLLMAALPLTSVSLCLHPAPFLPFLPFYPTFGRFANAAYAHFFFCYRDIVTLIYRTWAFKLFDMFFLCFVFYLGVIYVEYCIVHLLHACKAGFNDSHSFIVD